MGLEPLSEDRISITVHTNVDVHSTHTHYTYIHYTHYNHYNHTHYTHYTHPLYPHSSMLWCFWYQALWLAQAFFCRLTYVFARP